MLESLAVRNYVLIDTLDISFEEGFSVLTGETGSGKTIMLGAISLLLGAKADRNAIRTGCSSAEISGVFRTAKGAVLSFLDERGIPCEDGEIVIRRSIRESGRSSYTVNGMPMTLHEGRMLGSLLVDISSQHEQQSLMRGEVLLAMLDATSGSDIEGYRAAYAVMKEAERREAELAETVRKGEDESDYMRFALNELESAGLKEGEEEEIRARLGVMNASEFLRSSLSSVIEELRAASSAISDSLSTMQKAEKKDEGLSSLSERLESMDIECSDIILTARDHLSLISFSESDLEEANERLSVIQRVKKKYGGTVEEAIRRRDDYKARLAIAGDGERLLAKAHEDTEKARAHVRSLALSMSEARKKGAKALERSVEEHLHRLGMEKALFRISLSRMDNPGPDGIDEVSFLIAPNKGEKLSPIQSTASGGELSRIMLALKSSIKGGGDIETMLFDEIDSGIGGKVASSVADELKDLSRINQVIAITHLPQLAVKAGCHFLVYKEEKGGRTMTRIVRIEGEERVKEIARLLSGETSAISLEHARALLEVQ